MSFNLCCLYAFTRSQFTEGRFAEIEAHLEALATSSSTETANLVTLRESKLELEKDIENANAALEETKEDLRIAQTTLEERTRELELDKRNATKANKQLDSAFKEIGSKVKSLSMKALLLRYFLSRRMML